MPFAVIVELPAALKVDVKLGRCLSALDDDDNICK